MSEETRPYRHFDKFVLRSPFFAFSFFQSLVAGDAISAAELKAACENPAVQEAILLASPDLFADLRRWLQGEELEKKKVERLQQSLLRYLLRMSTRSTPFGLFAGFTTGRVNGPTAIELVDYDRYSRHTRLDMHYLCALGQDLARRAEVREGIRYYPNSSIYQVGNQLRYVEYRYRNKRRFHHIVAVDYTEYLERVLQSAATGRFVDELAQLLVEEEITFAEAKEFIFELIDSQVLVNELEPAITGPEFLDQLRPALAPLAGIADVRAGLDRAADMIASINRSPIGTTVASYGQIEEQLKELKTEYEVKFLFQTDMVKPAERCQVDPAVMDDIFLGIERMNMITSRPANTLLGRFKEAFQERFETREVPLLLALDLECGIGYRQSESRGDDSPLIDDIGVVQPGSQSQEIAWDGWQSFLLKKYLAATEKQELEVELTDADFKNFRANWSDLPDTIATMVRIVAGKHGAEGRPRIYISSVGGSSAANLLGRFCHADDELLAFTREITAREQELNPDVIYAEIIHLPESRTGNILLRPILRPYEIPYLAKAAVAPEFQLRLDDLSITLKNNRLVLRSRRLGREIVPRLSTAHNYSFNSIPVYHFLADLQHQDRRGGVYFSWGSLQNEYAFLPRVTYKNLIFAFARWKVAKEEIKECYDEKDDGRLRERVREWRQKKRIPQYVALDDSDNELVLNLENVTCVRNLLAVTKNRPSFQLEEFLFDPDSAIVRSREGVFVNEFIFAFQRVQPVKKTEAGDSHESAA